jgi:hypothetical protein
MAGAAVFDEGLLAAFGRLRFGVCAWAVGSAGGYEQDRERQDPGCPRSYPAGAAANPIHTVPLGCSAFCKQYQLIYSSFLFSIFAFP